MKEIIKREEVERKQFPPRLLTVINGECEVCRFLKIHLAEGFFLSSNDISEHSFIQLCTQLFTQVLQTVRGNTLVTKAKN